MNDQNEYQPQTLQELAAYIDRYQDSIYVREQVDGKWGAFALSELPTPCALSHALRFIQQGIIPTRIKEVSNES